MKTSIFQVAGGLAVCLLPLFGRPAPADSATASKVGRVGGTLTLTGSLDVSRGLPDGTSVGIYPTAELTGDPVYSGSAGVDANARVSGGHLSFSVSIPYSWLVTSTADTVTVELDLQGAASGASAQYSYTSYLAQTIALPKNGATTPVKFIGSL